MTPFLNLSQDLHDEGGFASTTIASQLGKDRKDKYKTLFISSVEAGPKPALEPDVAPGSTEQPGSKPFPLVPSPAALRAGYDALSLGPETSYFDSRLRDYLRQSVYSDNSLWSIYERPVLLGFLTLLMQLPFSIRKDIKRRLQMKYGRLLKGPVMLTPAEFNQQIGGDGIGFRTTESKDIMRIPARYAIVVSGRVQLSSIEILDINVKQG